MNTPDTTNTTNRTDITAQPHTAAATMRAVVQERYGSSDTWQLTETERPTIRDDEVLVRVHAAGLDRGTWHEMTGRPYLMRLMGFGLRSPKRRVPGRALSGTVAAVGTNVTRFAVGDEVFGAGVGAFAEYAVAPEAKLAHKPSVLTYEQAAAVPISATTALQALRQGRIALGQGGRHRRVGWRRHLRRADRRRLRRRRDGRVQRSQGRPRSLARCSARDRLRRRRWDQRIAPLRPDRRHRRERARRRLHRALEPTGSLVIVGGESKGNFTGGLGRSLRAPLVSLVSLARGRRCSCRRSTMPTWRR